MKYLGLVCFDEEKPDENRVSEYMACAAALTHIGQRPPATAPVYTHALARGRMRMRKISVVDGPFAETKG